MEEKKEKVENTQLEAQKQPIDEEKAQTRPITYEDIERANKTIKTTDIKGKDYAEVNQRVRTFRMVYPTGFIKTNILSLENGVVTMQTKAGYYENGEEVVLATGIAQEKENSTFINKTSYLENAETSAVGRALGMAGFGIDTSIASAEEVANEVNNQAPKKAKATRPQVDYRNLLFEELKKQDIDVGEYAIKNKLNAKTTQERAKELLEELQRAE